MKPTSRSAAMTEAVDEAATAHLLRNDRQEDLCFAIWRPSQGATRTTALIERLILPGDGDRNVHGNVSFESRFFERALADAAAAGAGLALLHSHPLPLGRGWQGMSPDDVRAEQNNAGAVFGATGLPFVGLTLAGDRAWSARFWERTAPKTYTGQWCTTVRVVGERLKIHYAPHLAPPPCPTKEQVRTVSAWGEEAQADLVRTCVGIVGNGSVGGFIGEALVRTGFQDTRLYDFDRVEEHNLDRLNYATRADIGTLKVEVLASYMRARATGTSAQVTPIVGAVYDEDIFHSTLDCDVLFSCVDRPWGRHVLNLIAYGHLIPVVDGGICVRTTKSGKLASADWRAHTATIGRPCLQCLGQYDPSLVQSEREGLLDDPRYIEGLPRDHALRARENVFAFSMACASQQMLQMLALILAPNGLPNSGAQHYHFVGGFMEPNAYGECHPTCLFPSTIALGDHCGFEVTCKPQEAHAGAATLPALS